MTLFHFANYNSLDYKIVLFSMKGQYYQDEKRYVLNTIKITYCYFKHSFFLSTYRHTVTAMQKSMTF